MKLYLSFAVGLLLAVPATAQVTQAEGAELFSSKGCAYWHGSDAHGIAGKTPSLVHVGFKNTAEEIRRQIHDGGLAMPAFGEVLSEEELKALMEYLSKMKASPAGSVKRKKGL